MKGKPLEEIAIDLNVNLTDLESVKLFTHIDECLIRMLAESFSNASEISWVRINNDIKQLIIRALISRSEDLKASSLIHLDASLRILLETLESLNKAKEQSIAGTRAYINISKEIRALTGHIVKIQDEIRELKPSQIKREVEQANIFESVITEIDKINGVQWNANTNYLQSLLDKKREDDDSSDGNNGNVNKPKTPRNQ